MRLQFQRHWDNTNSVIAHQRKAWFFLGALELGGDFEFAAAVQAYSDLNHQSLLWQTRIRSPFAYWSSWIGEGDLGLSGLFDDGAVC